jgi:predicted DNA-binding protein with PD1-like motif
MDTRLLHSTPEGARRYACICHDGDEAMAELVAFAAREGIGAATVQGIGAVSSAVMAFYLRETFEYDLHPIDEQVEVLSLLGNITLLDGEPRLHLHGTFGYPDGSVRGGHVMELRVWPTLEFFVDAVPFDLPREFDEACGLPTIRP